MKPGTLELKDLTPELWPALEELFGANGACGGCWCMYWRIARGERWEDVKGPAAKRRMRRLVASGKALGILAFAGGEPVGWCAYGPRRDFARLDRARTLACDDVERVWSLPCFFIRRGWRGKGVAAALLRHALQSLGRRKAEVAEGYPVKPARKGSRIPDAFAWTGTCSLFEQCGFQPTGDTARSKVRMRRRP